MVDDDEVYGLHCDIGRLEAENLRLRQQVGDMWKVVWKAYYDGGISWETFLAVKGSVLGVLGGVSDDR